MEQTNKSRKPVSGQQQNEFFSDEITKKKIDRHLSDINDTISDQDIKNVITDINSENLNDTNDNGITNAEGDSILPDEEAKQMPTSWNIID